MSVLCGALWLWLPGCASLAGLQELEALPSTFPLSIEAPLGRITSPRGGTQISVDLVHPDEQAARSDWRALIEQATHRGLAVVEEGRVDKRDRVVLEGASGRLQLECCPQRADRQRLILISWWPAAGE